MSLSALRIKPIGPNLDPAQWRQTNLESRDQAKEHTILETVSPLVARRLVLPRLREFNLSQPFFRVNSDDVLRIAFKALVDDDSIHTAFSRFNTPHPRTAPLSLWGVSRHAAGLVEGQTEFWSSVSGVQHDFNSPHPELMKLWIRRAGETRLLDFHIAPPRWKYDDCSGGADGIMMKGMEGFEDEMTPAILKIFMDHMPRWRDIAFEFDDALAPHYLNRLSSIVSSEDTSRRPEKVEHLELVARKVRRSKNAEELFRSLEVFAGSATKVLWGGPRGMTLTVEEPIELPKVKVLGLEVFDAEQMSRCLKKLEMPVLEELRICFVGEEDSEDVLRSPVPVTLEEPIKLPRLKVLALDVVDIEEVFGCLKKLELPALEELKICFVAGEGNVPWVKWKYRVDEFFKAVEKLPHRPDVLWIHDDGLRQDRRIVEILTDKALRECDMGILALRAEQLKASQVDRYFEGQDYCVVENLGDGSIQITV